MSDLADERCVPCRGGVPALGARDVRRLAEQLPGWTVKDDHHLVRTWETEDFLGALELVNRLGRISEEQDHHPELTLSWGWVEAKIWTHKVDGLTKSDFVLAAKFDRAARDLVREGAR